MNFSVEIIEKDNAIICYLTGRIVYETEAMLKSSMEKAISEFQHRKIVLNMKDLTYINSSGIGILVKILKETKSAGKILHMCCLQPTIFEVFKITNLNQIFKIFDSEEEALEE